MSVSDDLVFKGGWVNYNHPAVVGGRITVTSPTSDLLNIFIGIFVVFLESGAWTLITLLVFHIVRLWDGSRAKDALHHQKQVILRNVSDDRGIALEFLGLWTGWRESLGRTEMLRRVAPMGVAALLSFLFFLVALPFLVAYKLQNHDDEVLVAGPNCGFWQQNTTDSSLGLTVQMWNETRDALNYADNCYETDAASGLCDDFLVTRSISFDQQQVNCPFGLDMCLADGLMLTAGPIDSHTDLGLNAAPEDRIQFSRRATCAPINTAGRYKETTNSTSHVTTYSLELGPSPLNTEGYTFSTTVYQSSIGNEEITLASPGDYFLIAYTAMTANGFVETDASMFTPITELWVNNSDITLIFLANRGVLVSGVDGPCEDPFFSATRSCPVRFNDVSLCAADSPITVIGCAEQYRLTDPVSNNSTAWGSLTDLSVAAQGLAGLSPGQVAAAIEILFASSMWPSIGWPALIASDDALMARKNPGMFFGMQSPLPNDQWQLELRYWFSTVLAGLQLAFVDVATGPPDPSVYGLQNTMDAVAADFFAASRSTLGGANLTDLLCRSQKVHDSSFANFNRSGFIALAVIGGFFILFPPLLLYLLRRAGAGTRSSALWNAYGKQELLRMALEQQGTNWEKCDEEVPIEKTATWRINVGDLEHPVVEMVARPRRH